MTDNHLNNLSVVKSENGGEDDNRDHKIVKII